MNNADEQTKRILIEQAGDRVYSPGDSYASMWGKIVENEGVKLDALSRVSLMTTWKAWLNHLGGSASALESPNRVLGKILVELGGTPSVMELEGSLIRKIREAMGNGPGPDPLHPLTLDYIARVEAKGGSFDLTAIDPVYTEAFGKGVTDALVRYLNGEPNGFFGTPPMAVSDVWDKLAEIYPLAGVTFPGILEKLKYDSVPTLTNVNFVSGDYVPVGDGAGLTGKSSARLEHNYVIPTGTASMGLYLCTNDNTSNGRIMGAYEAGAPGRTLRYQLGGDSVRFFGGLAATNSCDSTIEVGLFVGVAGPGGSRLYENGDLVNTQTDAYNSPEKQAFGLNINGLSGTTTCRQALEFNSDGELTDTQAAYFSWCVNAWATYFGFNTYDNP